MEPVNAVSLGAGSQPVGPAVGPGLDGATGQNVAPIEIVTPATASQPGEGVLGSAWKRLDELSGEMKNLWSVARAQLQPPPVGPSSGDMLTDMRRAVNDSYAYQLDLLKFQVRINEAQGVFSIALGMVQSAQSGVRTLFQDK